MTVAELIKILQQAPQDSDVEVEMSVRDRYGDSYDDVFDVVDVRVETPMGGSKSVVIHVV